MTETARHTPNQQLAVRHRPQQADLEATISPSSRLAALPPLEGTTHPYPLPLRSATQEGNLSTTQPQALPLRHAGRDSEHLVEPGRAGVTEGLLAPFQFERNVGGCRTGSIH